MIAVLLALAGLMGAAGVILTAAAAHSAPGTGLDSAGWLLLIHAAAVLGGIALMQQGMTSRPIGLIAFSAFILGGILFAADVAARAYLGHRLFPMAAPTGGVIMIGGWLLFALAAVVGK